MIKHEDWFLRLGCYGVNSCWIEIGWQDVDFRYVHIARQVVVDLLNGGAAIISKTCTMAINTADAGQETYGADTLIDLLERIFYIFGAIARIVTGRFTMFLPCFLVVSDCLQPGDKSQQQADHNDGEIARTVPSAFSKILVPSKHFVIDLRLNRQSQVKILLETVVAADCSLCSESRALLTKNLDFCSFFQIIRI